MSLTQAGFHFNLDSRVAKLRYRLVIPLLCYNICYLTKGFILLIISDLLCNHIYDKGSDCYPGASTELIKAFFMFLMMPPVKGSSRSIVTMWTKSV